MLETKRFRLRTSLKDRRRQESQKPFSRRFQGVLSYLLPSVDPWCEEFQIVSYGLPCCRGVTAGWVVLPLPCFVVVADGLEMGQKVRAPHVFQGRSKACIFILH